MPKVNAWKVAFAVGMLCLPTASAQTYRILVNFDGANGDEPNPSYLAQGTNSVLYGTTEAGGPGGSGTIFGFRGGKLTTLYSFSCTQNGCAQDAPSGLIFATNSLLYGTTVEGGNTICEGGCGTVFQITQGGALTTLHNFSSTDGAYPRGNLTEGVDGSFYGVTTAGGAYNLGTVFKITPTGTLNTLHSFDGTDGASPVAGLTQGNDGNFYGTTQFGGNPACDAGCGTAFRITSKGALTILYNFCAQPSCTDGNSPISALFQGTSGNFYGTTYYGGSGNYGTVFGITPEGALTTLYSFCSMPACDDGIFPLAGVAEGTDGNLYGTASAGGANGTGTAFNLTLGGTLNVLQAFDPSHGGEPETGLLQATNGTFYGTNFYGGLHNAGTLFSLDMGLGPFVAFVRAAGVAGQTALILGQGFTGTSGVLFNGIEASYTVVSDTFIKATVPTGATNGYVTVTTPTGTLTSNVQFHVLP